MDPFFIGYPSKPTSVYSPSCLRALVVNIPSFSWNSCFSWLHFHPRETYAIRLYDYITVHKNLINFIGYPPKPTSISSPFVSSRLRGEHSLFRALSCFSWLHLSKRDVCYSSLRVNVI